MSWLGTRAYGRCSGRTKGCRSSGSCPRRKPRFPCTRRRSIRPGRRKPLRRRRDIASICPARSPSGQRCWNVVRESTSWYWSCTISRETGVHWRPWPATSRSHMRRGPRARCRDGCRCRCSTPITPCGNESFWAAQMIRRACLPHRSSIGGPSWRDCPTASSCRPIGDVRPNRVTGAGPWSSRSHRTVFRRSRSLPADVGRHRRWCCNPSSRCCSTGSARGRTLRSADRSRAVPTKH
ncbi:Uncharacterised protein [Rhodococcus wratislaviensis]|uniref:Uncharacterized protein n=1 Tax=Rhodococcus wratislaviensis TaxID=44752 RepID=A0AB38F980_RHOWR|nr:Uncharacterised protein [Rhodococcus wratislaviensis]